MRRALLIDDEPEARAELRRLLGAHANITVVAEAGNLGAARVRLAAADYDLVFLDVQLIGGSGFDLVPFVREGARTIFVTALDQHAIRAFEVNAHDYLLKPVRAERLEASLQRLAPARSSSPPLPLIASDLVCLRLAGGERFLTVADISAIVADGNYCAIYLAGGERLLVRHTMKSWGQRLPAAQFVRLHRCAFINVTHIIGIQRDALHRPWLSLRGMKVPLATSRRQWRDLRSRRNGSGFKPD